MFLSPPVVGIVEVPPQASLADVTQIFGCLPGAAIADFTAEKLLIHFPALCTYRFYVHIDSSRVKTSRRKLKNDFSNTFMAIKIRAFESSPIYRQVINRFQRENDLSPAIIKNFPVKSKL